MKLLCDKNAMVLCNVFENQIHGTSYIFEIKMNQVNDSNVEAIMENERSLGLYDNNTYTNYNLLCLQYKNNFYNKILEYKLKDKQIIAFGSTAKSMTLLNFCNITNKHVDFMIDENPLKQGLYTPGSNILVHSISNLNNINKDCVILITAWNFYNEIKEKIQYKLKELDCKFKVTLLNIDSLQEETM
jgi:hypothetical protein